MTKSINPYKPIVDSKFIIEQAENKDMSVWEFLKGFSEVSVLEVNVNKVENGIELEFVRGISRQYIVLNFEELQVLFRVIQKVLKENCRGVMK